MVPSVRRGFFGVLRVGPGCKSADVCNWLVRIHLREEDDDKEYSGITTPGGDYSGSGAGLVLVCPHLLSLRPHPTSRKIGTTYAKKVVR